jgi:hypothetical protein
MSKDYVLLNSIIVTAVAWSVVFPIVFKSFYLDGGVLARKIIQSSIPLMFAAACMGFRFPERFFPGKFDIWVSSYLSFFKALRLNFGFSSTHIQFII